MTSIAFLNKSEQQLLVSDMYGDYLHGKCYEFAIALHEGLSLPLVGIQVGDEIIHAGVKSADDVYRDVRGDLTFKEFIQGFDITSEFIVRPTTREELELLFVWKTRVELPSEFIDRARIHAESLWPSWAWKNSQATRMENFVNDLEDLCRKHGIWIREQFPASPSIIYFGDEIEKGYSVQQMSAARLQFFLTQTFS